MKLYAPKFITSLSFAGEGYVVAADGSVELPSTSASIMKETFGLQDEPFEPFEEKKKVPTPRVAV
jgi:hypothetical protein